MLAGLAGAQAAPQRAAAVGVDDDPWAMPRVIACPQFAQHRRIYRAYLEAGRVRLRDRHVPSVPPAGPKVWQEFVITIAEDEADETHETELCFDGNDNYVNSPFTVDWVAA